MSPMVLDPTPRYPACYTKGNMKLRFRFEIARFATLMALAAACGSTPSKPVPPVAPPSPVVPVTASQAAATTRVTVLQEADPQVVVAKPATELPSPVPIVIPARLNWPADTKMVRLAETIHVLSKPDDKSPPIGKVVRGTLTQWVSFVEVAGAPAIPAPETGKKAKPKKRPKNQKCWVWTEIKPQGWVCSHSLAPSKELVATGIEQPVIPDGKIVPGDYFIVYDGAPAYGSRASILAAKPLGEPMSATMLKSLGVVEVEGVEYHYTTKGLIPSARMGELSPSKFSGFELGTAGDKVPSWPFAITSAGKGGLVIRSEPNSKASKIGSKSNRLLVPVIAEKDGFIAIAGSAASPSQWIDRKQLRVINKQSLPAGVTAQEQWLDVDLDQQTVVAYQGETPVFATLVSTGRVAGTTPIGKYRIRSKAALMRMAGEPGTKETYDVGAIPWSIRFKKGVFFHASYWHDVFGNKKSHGCVNLSPKDARYLYRWTQPHMPEGWMEIEVAPDAGPVVRVRDAANPDPAWYDYAADSTAQSPDSAGSPQAEPSDDDTQ
jgi:hypothetical protein